MSGAFGSEKPICYKCGREGDRHERLIHCIGSGPAFGLESDFDRYNDLSGGYNTEVLDEDVQQP